MFTTDRLRLRAIRATDEDDFVEMWNDPVLMARLVPLYLAPKPKSFFEWYTRNIVEPAVFHVVIELKDTSEFVGDCILKALRSAKDRNAGFGICIKQKFWNKGYGTEVTRFVVDHAFHWLGMHRVSLEVYESNLGAIGAYKRSGFIEEGRRRKAIWIDGKWDDEVLMGIVEDEWRKQGGSVSDYKWRPKSPT